MVNDEQHFVAYDKDPKHVILESENLDGLEYENHGRKSVAGWAYPYGKGRSGLHRGRAIRITPCGPARISNCRSGR